MGRIRTTIIKNLAEKILNENREKFSKDFNHNKNILKEIMDIKSKKLRNKVAGYITFLLNSG
ncbi:MAG: 30S ribosomal protein S17e [Candidatus Aenigmarchaeota archaeon]|nr:30S ribosomal protein S17e [Candidatus Aenigmarchaeota archaeon]MDW8149162.1 30S ribosomal protein S17e [Candidatus Aenigmarchaeota archaeon]